MAETMTLRNGKPVTIHRMRDFEELIDQHMGMDAARFFRELVEETADRFESIRAAASLPLRKYDRETIDDLAEEGLNALK